MKIILYLITGFILAFCIHAIFGIGCKSNNTEPENNTDQTQQIKAAANNIEDIMRSKDTLKLIENMTPTLQELYKDKYFLIVPKMAQFADAFKNRKFELAGPNYGEFTFIENSVLYTISFALQDDGSWKLMNF